MRALMILLTRERDLLVGLTQIPGTTFVRPVEVIGMVASRCEMLYRRRLGTSKARSQRQWHDGREEDGTYGRERMRNPQKRRGKNATSSPRCGSFSKQKQGDQQLDVGI